MELFVILLRIVQIARIINIILLFYGRIDDWICVCVPIYLSILTLSIVRDKRHSKTKAMQRKEIFERINYK